LRPLPRMRKAAHHHAGFGPVAEVNREPRPRFSRSGPRPDFRFNYRRTLPLARNPAAPRESFAAVIERRASNCPTRAISVAALGEVLWLAARRKHAGGEWELRPAPSAGGLHPAELFALRLAASAPVFWYDPRMHVLQALLVPRGRSSSVSRDVRELLPRANGWILFVAAYAARTGWKYRNPDSLVWRDVGAFFTIHAALRCRMRTQVHAARSAG
jgi:hypothetical protein